MLGPSSHTGPGEAPHRLSPPPLLEQGAANSCEAGAGEQPCCAKPRAQAARLGGAAWGLSREPLGWRACGSRLPGLSPPPEQAARPSSRALRQPKREGFPSSPWKRAHCHVSGSPRNGEPGAELSLTPSPAASSSPCVSPPAQPARQHGRIKSYQCSGKALALFGPRSPLTTRR